MRNEILRDVLAGCAGVLAVVAVIGVPRDAAAVQHSQQFLNQHAVLLPHYTHVAPQAPVAPTQPGFRHVPIP
jgi:hypothetical protein